MSLSPSVKAELRDTHNTGIAFIVAPSVVDSGFTFEAFAAGTVIAVNTKSIFIAKSSAVHGNQSLRGGAATGGRMSHRETCISRAGIYRWRGGISA